MQGLKALVIIMGVLIVAGTTALAVLMVKKFNNMGSEENSATVEQEMVAPEPVIPVTKGGLPAFGEITETLPQGSEVISTRMSQGLLLVRYRTEAGEAFLVFDLVQGRKQGTVKLQIAQ